MAQQTDLKAIPFRYKAIDAAGNRVEAKMIAPSEDDVLDALRRSNMLPLQVKRADRLSLDGDVMAAIRGSNAAKLSTGELSQFTRQLYQLLKAGIPITAAMQTMAEDPPSDAVGEVFHTVADRLINGVTLSEAFAGFPKVFNEVFIAYMAAGESSGNLVDVTQRLAVILDKRAEISRKVKAVSMYPMLVSSIIVLMIAAIIVFIVPKYVEIYSSLDAKLPAPTRFVVALSTYFPFVAVAIAGAAAGFLAWNRSKKDDLDIGAKIDRAKFRMPIFGKMFKKLALYRFASTMGGALESGVQTFDALALSARASDSRWVRATTPDLQRAVREGRHLTTAMVDHDDLFTPTMRKMVATGEETGDLGSMFGNVADALRDEIDLQISTMSAKIEVALLVGMGAAVGGILAAMYLPILQLTLTAGDKYGF